MTTTPTKKPLMELVHRGNIHQVVPPHVEDGYIAIQVFWTYEGFDDYYVQADIKIARNGAVEVFSRLMYEPNEEVVDSLSNVIVINALTNKLMEKYVDDKVINKLVEKCPYCDLKPITVLQTGCIRCTNCGLSTGTNVVSQRILDWNLIVRAIKDAQAQHD